MVGEGKYLPSPVHELKTCAMKTACGNTQSAYATKITIHGKEITNSFSTITIVQSSGVSLILKLLQNDHHQAGSCRDEINSKP